MATATNMIQLRPEVISNIKKSLQFRNALQYGLNISSQTLQRWLVSNSSNLTTATALKIISEELGCRPEDLLNEVAA